MIYSIASQKGGTGKTSWTRRPTAVKCSCPATKRFSKEDTVYATVLERKPLRIHKTSINNLDIVPSHILLSNTDIELTTAKDHQERSGQGDQK